jgi:hypothetical protein
MKRFFEDPLRVFLSTIASAFVLCMLVLFTTSCESESEFDKIEETIQATQVVNHNAESIIVETLHDGRDFDSGIFKVTIDGVEYIVVSNYGSGTAIIKHIHYK